MSATAARRFALRNQKNRQSPAYSKKSGQPHEGVSTAVCISLLAATNQRFSGQLQTSATKEAFHRLATSEGQSMFRRIFQSVRKKKASSPNNRRSGRTFEAFERREMMAADLGENLPHTEMNGIDPEEVAFIGDFENGAAYEVSTPIIAPFPGADSVDISLKENGGVLSISGSQSADNVKVSRQENFIIVSVSLASENGTTNFKQFYDATKVNSISFDGKAGDDHFTNDTDIPVLAYGGAGDDTLIGGLANDELQGGEGDDVLVGGRGDDRLFGQQGDDNIDGGHGDDLLSGEDGDDLLSGDQGNDLIYGGQGDDDLSGGWGDDELQGGEGDDRLLGGHDNNRLFGEAGYDWLDGVFENGQLTLDSADGSIAPLPQPHILLPICPFPDIEGEPNDLEVDAVFDTIGTGPSPETSVDQATPITPARPQPIGPSASEADEVFDNIAANPSPESSVGQGQPITAVTPQLISTPANASGEGLSRFGEPQRRTTVTLGAFTLSDVTMEETHKGFNITGTLNTPEIKDVKLTGFVSRDFTSYNLKSDPAALKIGPIELSDSVTKLDERGLTVTGNWSHALVGTITFTGKIGADGTRSLEAQSPSRSLLGGLVKTEPGTLTLTSTGITFAAKATVSRIGVVHFEGKIAADGSYKLGGSADFSLAGYNIAGAALELGQESLGVTFTLAIAGLGDVDFSGSYESKGEWSLTGVYPGPVAIGPVILKDLTLTIDNDFVRGNCKGTIAGLDQLIESDMTTTFFFDGRVETITVTDVLEIGNFRLGRSTVKASNNNPSRDYIVTIDSKLGIKNLVEVTVSGEIDEHGDYILKGKETVEILGFKFKDAEFTLEKGSGLTIQAREQLFGSVVDWSGKIDQRGDYQLTGTGAATIAGLTLSDAEFTLSKKNGLQISGSTKVLGASVKFNGEVRPNGSYTIEGSGKIGIPGLASQSAHFTLRDGRVMFTTTVDVLGTDLEFAGEIDANGKYDVVVEKKIKVSGVTLSDAKFRLTSKEGLTFRATVRQAGCSFAVNGAVGSRYVTFGGAINLGFGANVTIDAELVPSKNKWDIEIVFGGLGRLSAGQIANLLNLNGDMINDVFDNLALSMQSSVLTKLTHEALNVAMDRLPIKGIAAALEGVDGATLKAALAKFDPLRAADVLSTVSSETLTSALKRMGISQIAKVLPHFDGENLKAALKRLSASTIADVLNDVDVDTLKASLKRLDPSVVTKVVAGLDKQVAKTAGEYLKKLDPRKYGDAIDELAKKASSGLNKLDPSGWRL